MSYLFADQSVATTNYGWQTLLIYGLLFAGMWFLLIAPQKKKQKEHINMIAQLRAGDEVVTTSGIIGTITNVKTDRFVIKVDDNTKIEVYKAFVQSRVTKPELRSGNKNKK